MSRLARLLIVSLLLASSLTALGPAQVTSAAATIALNPTSGAPGSTVNVTVTGFKPGESLGMVWDYGLDLGGGTADSKGNFTGPFQVPSNASIGSHEVQVVDPYDLHSIAVGEQFQVEGSTGSGPTAPPSCPSTAPTVSISPQSGPPATQITATGSGWPAGEQVQYGFSGPGFSTQGGSTQAGSNGTLSVAFTVPQSASPGTISATFLGQSPCMITIANSIAFTVTAPPTQSTSGKVSLNPTSGCPGTPVSVSGTGWPQNANVDISWVLGSPNSSNYNELVLTHVVGDSNGQLSGTFTVPGAGYATTGAHSIVLDGDIPTTFVSFSVPSCTTPPQQKSPQPSSNCAGDEVMSFNPPNPASGQPVTISVTSAQASVNVNLSGPFTTGGPPQVVNGGKGWIWSWIVTPNAPGQYSYAFTVNGGGTCATGTLTVAQAQPQTCVSQTPKVTLNPTSGPPNTSVTATGSGWPTNQTVQWSAFSGQSGTVQADGGGGFTINFAVPANTSPQTIVANFLIYNGTSGPCNITVGEQFTVTPATVPTATPVPGTTPVFYCEGAWRSCQGKQRPLSDAEICYVPPETPLLKKSSKVAACNLYIATVISVGGLTLMDIYAGDVPGLLTGHVFEKVGENIWNALYRFWQDPPDPNYTVITDPSFPALAPVGPSGSLTQQQVDSVVALLTNLNQQAGYANALATSINRSQGAHAAGDADWESRQLKAAQAYAASLAGLADDEPGLLAAAQPALQTVLPNESLSPDDVTSIQAQIKANGLPAAFADALTSVGASSGDLDQIRSAIPEQDPYAVASLTGGKLPSALADPTITAWWHQLAQGLHQYANPDARYFSQTGFAIDNDTIYDYFTHRGGVEAFGYPTSRTFKLQGFTVQFFQRRIIQLDGNGQARLLNVLDPGLLPYTTFNGSTVPGVDPTLVATAPPASDLPSALAFVQQHAPDAVGGANVNFDQTFNAAVSAQVAFPNGGDAGLLPGFDLELWGLPTSGPMTDPNNHNFIYQRFQRGVMHYDASTGLTQGLLLADYLKAIMTGQNLPADVAAEAQTSPFLQQYDKNAPNWVHDPNRLSNTDLTNAFEPDAQ